MRVLVLIISVMVALVLVAGCATGGGGSQAAPIDQQFIDMMVPHHQGACGQWLWCHHQTASSST
jgi:hypothetical protein